MAENSTAMMNTTRSPRITTAPHPSPVARLGTPTGASGRPRRTPPAAAKPIHGPAVFHGLAAWQDGAPGSVAIVVIASELDACPS
jgi:hypothetical protein